MELFFSVIIPTLNEEKYLPKLLDDLVKQKEKNFEVIVIDGGSEDKTEEMAKGYRDYLSLFFYQNQKRNVSSQRNFGAAQAHGKYLIFLDADSRIFSTFTRIAAKTIKKEKGLIFIPYITPGEKNLQLEIVFRLADYLAEYSYSVGRPFSLGGNMIVEKNYFQLIGGFPEDMFVSEDHGLIIKAYKWGIKGKFLKNTKVKINLRRMKKEGIRLWYKNHFVAISHVLLEKKVNRKTFKYEMGGHLYFNKEKKQTADELLKKYLQQAKKFLNQLF